MIFWALSIEKIDVGDIVVIETDLGAEFIVRQATHAELEANPSFWKYRMPVPQQYEFYKQKGRTIETTGNG